MARRISLILAALLTGAVACVRRGVREYPAGTVAGYYVNAFEEQNVFRTCDRRAYLLVAPEDFWKRHKQINDVAAEYARPIRVFAVVAATVEPLEPNSTRAEGTEGRLTVTRVYRMRRAGDDDCANWLARR